MPATPSHFVCEPYCDASHTVRIKLTCKRLARTASATQMKSWNGKQTIAAPRWPSLPSRQHAYENLS